ncbi:hypothetical protein BH23GEM10_BH23GEM10_15160 [soil metagenome]
MPDEGSRTEQEAGGKEPQSDEQPPQAPGRRVPAHEHEPTVRKGYESAENPEQQGDGDPRPLNEQPDPQGTE